MEKEKSVERLDRLVERRRRQLARARGANAAGRESAPQGSGEIWGLALSGGGIRSATFCFGVLRALAQHKLLLRFDLLSTVSGGGYVGGMLGRLFDRATVPDDVVKVEDSMAGAETRRFGWWLRSNGRYLAPGGGADRLFALALYMRNLLGIHVELALVGLLIGLLITGLDLGVWAVLDRMGYASSSVFDHLRGLEPWLPTAWLLAPIPAAIAARYALAYWQLPWATRSDGAALAWWWGVAASALGVASFMYLYWFPRSAAIAQSFRDAIAAVILAIWLVGLWAVPLARSIGLREGSIDRARNAMTTSLATWGMLTAAVLAAGIVDRLAWRVAFEASLTLDLGLALGLAAVLLRGILPAIAASGTRAPRISAFAGTVARFAGILLAFALLVWWIAVIHKTIASTVFTDRELTFSNALAPILLASVILGAYMLLSGSNLEFLNLSSLHAFYRARLVRSYLGAANGARFDRSPLDGALEPMERWAHTAPVGSNVGEVHGDDDRFLKNYKPQRFGGPIHLINVCINQTADPKGALFNQDRKGLSLTIASGGRSQVSQEGWTVSSGLRERGLGTWMAVSGAAVSPGLGYRTSRGLSALLTFAGIRLGFWLTEAARNGRAAGFLALGKTWSLLRETFGIFDGARGKDWFLSDGGHFENTGAYALLAERAKVIVLVDCGADPEYQFHDLENLVRRARIDLGADIKFQRPVFSSATNAVEAQQKAPAGWPSQMTYFGSLNDLVSPDSTACLAIAKVEYSEDRSQGLLILIKPNMCQGLGMDLINYKAQCPDFPQQSTGDQFFSEAQWESYFQLGNFLAEKLEPKFLKSLIADPGLYFEEDIFPVKGKDSAATPEKPKESADSKSGAEDKEKTRRLPTRINVAAVGATLGLGAAATVGISLWQALDSARVAEANQVKSRREAMKELTELWSRLPPLPVDQTLLAEVNQARSEASDIRTGNLERGASDPYSALAAAIVRTSDSLCPGDEAGWLKRSELGNHIVTTAVSACQLLVTPKTPACIALLEADNPTVRSNLPGCLRYDDKLLPAAQVRYWGYDYTMDAAVGTMHPCDPQLAKLAEDEKLHERERAKLKLRQAGDRPDTQKPCNWQSSPVSSPPPTDTPKLSTESVSEVQPTQPPLPSASPPASASAQPASSAASAANRPSNLPAIDSNICRRKTVYVQIYGPAQRDAVRKFRPVWQALGASVPPIENVNDAARRAGRPDPKPVGSTIVRYHDEGSRACADAISQNASGNEKPPNWKVERLSARLQPTPGNIEVWIAPDDPIVAKPVLTQ
ncbi:patatin-like phospholipase family protein [Variovorax sp.]|jgi:hypothetical protein|uniref:patatin-like phospholipase family protein n=1 Tax=Variovorax sp. TaxID=1871043 RepID=UPI001206CB24|nr:patatin-like phospholipase family protein [Variovorax sp.]TAJ60416.1 MAG: hypothetical protein EPO53_26935 [Variovorax sp.]